MKLLNIILLLAFLFPYSLQADGFKMLKIDSAYMKNELNNFPKTVWLSTNTTGGIAFNLWEHLAILKDGKININKTLIYAIDEIKWDTVSVVFKVLKLTDDFVLYTLLRNGSSFNSSAGTLFKLEDDIWYPVVSDITGEYNTKNPPTGFDIAENGDYWILSAGRTYFYKYDGVAVTKVYGVDTINHKEMTFYPTASYNGIKIIGDGLFYYAYGGLAKYNIQTGRREMFIPSSVWANGFTKTLAALKYKPKDGKYWFATSKPSFIGFDENSYEIIDLSGGKFADEIKNNYSYIEDFYMADDGTYWLSVLQDSLRLFHIFDKDSFRIHREIMSMHWSSDTLMPDLSGALAIEQAPNGTIYIVTELGALLYYGENPLYVKDDIDKQNDYGLRSVYPNPAKDQINVDILCNSDFNPSTIGLDLYSYSGEKIKTIKNFSLVMNKSSGKATIKFDTPSGLKGFYFLSITIDNSVQARSIIIER